LNFFLGIVFYWHTLYIYVDIITGIMCAMQAPVFKLLGPISSFFSHMCKTLGMKFAKFHPIDAGVWVWDHQNLKFTKL